MVWQSELSIWSFLTVLGFHKPPELFLMRMPISPGTAGTVTPCSDAVIPYSAGSSHADFCHGPRLSIAAELCEMPVAGGWLRRCAPMLQSRRAQYLPKERLCYSIILRHCCWQAWPLPRACTSATPRQTGCLHCIPAVYHLFSISLLHLPFFKSVCSRKVSGWFPGLCCWKQNRVCYLFQGAGQAGHQATRWGFKGLLGWFFFFSFSQSLPPALRFFKHTRSHWARPWCALMVRTQRSRSQAAANHWAGNDSLLPALTVALNSAKKFNWFSLKSRKHLHVTLDLVWE